VLRPAPTGGGNTLPREGWGFAMTKGNSHAATDPARGTLRYEGRVRRPSERSASGSVLMAVLLCETLFLLVFTLLALLR